MNRIVNLSVDKIAAVDAPANRRRFLVVKSARGSPDNQPPGNPDSHGKEATMGTENLRESVRKMDLSAFSLTDEGEAQLRKSMNEAVEAAAEEAAEAARQEAAQAADSDDTATEDVDKSELPEPVRKRLEEAEKLQKAADERVRKLEEDRANQVYLEKAEKLPSLPLDLEERRDTLKALGEAAPEAFAKLESALFDLQSQVDRSDLFKAVGADGQGSTGPDSEIQKAARKMRETDPNLTEEQAYVKALRENPTAYDAQIGE